MSNSKLTEKQKALGRKWAGIIGSIKTLKKAISSRKNGKLGGRHKKETKSKKQKVLKVVLIKKVNGVSQIEE